MNIFATSACPRACAEYLDDKRVVKMILETGQMLATCGGVTYVWIADEFGVKPYRPTHQHHPCTRWVATSRGNYDWLLQHFRWLSHEYTFRYGRVHKTWAEQKQPLWQARMEIPEGEMTPFVYCGPDEFICDDVHESYRRLMKAKWRDSAPKWTRRSPPCEL